MQPPGRRYYSFLSINFGLITNLDIGTEHLRWGTSCLYFNPRRSFRFCLIFCVIECVRQGAYSGAFFWTSMQSRVGKQQTQRLGCGAALGLGVACGQCHTPAHRAGPPLQPSWLAPPALHFSSLWFYAPAAPWRCSALLYLAIGLRPVPLSALLPPTNADGWAARGSLWGRCSRFCWRAATWRVWLSWRRRTLALRAGKTGRPQQRRRRQKRLRAAAGARRGRRRGRVQGRTPGQQQQQQGPTWLARSLSGARWRRRWPRGRPCSTPRSSISWQVRAGVGA